MLQTERCLHCTPVEVLCNSLNSAGQQTEAEGVNLCAVQKRWVDELVVCVVQRLEDVLDSLDLSSREARRGISSGVADRDRGNIKVTKRWVFQNAVIDTIESLVALVENVGLDKSPLGKREEGVVAGRA